MIPPRRPRSELVLALALPATLLAQGATQSISTGTFAGITARIPMDVAEDVARRTAAVKRDIARAKAGDLDARYALGMRLIRGDDLVRKPAKGVLWLEDAAQAGEPRSQYRMGQILARGLFGRVRDPAAARTWFTRAASQGLRRAAAAAQALERREGLAEGARRAPVRAHQRSADPKHRASNRAPRPAGPAPAPAGSGRTPASRR